MDNIKLDIQGHTEQTLIETMHLVWTLKELGMSTANTITHYEFAWLNQNEYPGIFTRNRSNTVCTTHSLYDKGLIYCLILYSDLCGVMNIHGTNISLLPYPIDLEGTIQFVKGWLASNRIAPPRPNFDGNCISAWRVFTDNWGKVTENSSVCAIAPIHGLIGK